MIRFGTTAALAMAQVLQAGTHCSALTTPPAAGTIASATDLAEHFPVAACLSRPLLVTAPSPMPLMRSVLPRLAAILLAAVLALPAFAQTRIPSLDQDDRRGEIGRAARQKAVERFDSADADKDGRLTREEVTGHFSYMTENFEQMDKNRDGALDWEEFIGHNRWKKE